jgi:hypothetical protein
MTQPRSQPRFFGNLDSAKEPITLLVVRRVVHPVSACQMRPHSDDSNQPLRFMVARLRHQKRPFIGRSPAPHARLCLQVNPRDMTLLLRGLDDLAQLCAGVGRELDALSNRCSVGAAWSSQPGEHRCCDASTSQGERFAYGRNAQVRRSGSQRRSGYLGRAVRVTIGLHHDHQLRGGTRLRHPADVVANGVEVDLSPRQQAPALAGRLD